MSIIPKESKSSHFKKYIHLYTTLPIILTSSVAAVLLSYFFNPDINLHASLIQPFPNPRDIGQIQALIVRNDGKKMANHLTIKVKYPRIIQPLDYRIQSMELPVYQTRTDCKLAFQLERLPYRDSVIVAFAVDSFEIQPLDIRITHDDGTIKDSDIEHIKLEDRWGN